MAVDFFGPRKLIALSEQPGLYVNATLKLYVGIK
jgi:hypothetical protein